MYHIEVAAWWQRNPKIVGEELLDFASKVAEILPWFRPQGLGSEGMTIVLSNEMDWILSDRYDVSDQVVSSEDDRSLRRDAASMNLAFQLFAAENDIDAPAICEWLGRVERGDNSDGPEFEEFVLSVRALSDQSIGKVTAQQQPKFAHSDNGEQSNRDVQKVTSRHVAEFLDIELKSLVKTSWPDPVFKQQGSRPAEYLREDLIPVLECQYPQEDWDTF